MFVPQLAPLEKVLWDTIEFFRDGTGEILLKREVMRWQLL